MKEVEVKVVKYQSDDGKIFDDKEQALLHDKMLSGKVKTCPACGGSKTVDIYGDGRIYNQCSTCQGKGYVEKKEIWG